MSGGGLIDWAFSKARVVLTILFVMIVFGLHAFNTIPREADPDIPLPMVLVTLPLPGVSPEDGERLLIRPTELELQNVEGITQMDAIAYDGSARIILEFETSIDVDQAVTDVREAVDRAKAEFPTDAEEPVVTEMNAQTMFPIISVVLYGDAPERALFRIAKDLQDELEGVGGVLEANLVGAREERIEVLIDPDKLEALGLTEQEIAAGVVNNNSLVPAGSVRTADGAFPVKINGLIKTAEDAMSVVVRSDGEGVVTLVDVATVRRTFEDPTGYALFNGRPAIGVDITKRTGANIVDTIGEARAIVEAASADWPSSVRYEYLNDQSSQVRDILQSLTGSIVTAILLVMIVVIAALGVRPALMVGVSIPTSFLIGFTLLTVSGFTLNMMVMFAMVLAVGMLVDGAIVVVEYADRRRREGAPRRSAYMEASKRMFTPVLSSTATTLAAFLPFLFWEDVAGEFMKFLPVTLIYVLTASFLVAIIFVPVVGGTLAAPKWLQALFSRISGKGAEAAPARAATPAEDFGADPRTLTGAAGSYARFLSGAIERPFLVMAVAGVIFGVCILSVRIAQPTVEFFIRADQEQVDVLVLSRGNASPQQELATVRQVEEMVKDHPAIEHRYVKTGPELSLDQNSPPDTIGRVSLDLVPFAEREHSQKIVAQLKEMTEGAAGVLIEVRQPDSGPQRGKDVQIELAARDYDALIAAAGELNDFMADARIDVGGAETHVFVDVEDTRPLPGVEWRLAVDREEAGRFGVDVQQIGAMVQLVTSGLKIDTVRPDDSDEEIDVRVRYPSENRSILALDQVRVQTPQGAAPISNFVDREAANRVDQVVRRDGRRIMEVKANANDLDPERFVGQDTATEVVREWLSAGGLDPAIAWRLRGADEETAEAGAFFAVAMSAAMFLIAIILLLQFDSFYHAALTLSAVIFSVFGVLLGVSLSGQYISIIMTGTGIIALAGIVVNNNIVLIDTYRDFLRGGLDPIDAVVRTAVQRARPVLLTTITTMLGLLPMVFQLNLNYRAGVAGIGSQTSDWWVLLSSAIVYGLAFATMLTLILTPVLLAAPTVVGARAKQLFESRSTAAPVPSGSGAPQPAE
ncbi:MAG: efflux RND transporter permease subunit [Pseudomonadota bacterium]